MAAGRELGPVLAVRERYAMAVPFWPTVWAIALGAALWLRIGAIDAQTLSPDEAGRALEGLKIWRGGEVDYSAGPLLPNLLAIWFALFTASDGAARAPAALCGWAICLCPLLFRSRLGHGPTLASTVLLASSSVQILASRTVGPATLTLLALAVLLGCWLKTIESGDGRWLLGSA